MGWILAGFFTVIALKLILRLIKIFFSQGTKSKGNNTAKDKSPHLYLLAEHNVIKKESNNSVILGSPVKETFFRTGHEVEVEEGKVEEWLTNNPELRELNKRGV